ncbi:hypothetical protein GX865_00875 [Candidatus Saccharibacteria bacterium]|jgi:hypothetical protein|nr:hypothetical protein [Candidatus Saccharibacteria bacterium]
MEKIHHNLSNIDAIDDMRVLNYLVGTIKGLRPVSGSAVELALVDADDVAR